MTYVPRWGTVRTKPSSRSTATARRAVSRATSNSSPSSFSLGSGSISGRNSPASIRMRSQLAICRYGGSAARGLIFGGSHDDQRTWTYVQFNVDRRR